MSDGSVTREDLGRLILRLAVGGLMLFHGVDKVHGGIAGLQGMLTGQGLPGFFAYGVYVGEILAPVLIVLGTWVRTAALVVAFNMAVAIALAHSGDLLSLGAHGAWAIELPMLYLLGALAIALLGSGRLAVARG